MYVYVWDDYRVCMRICEATKCMRVLNSRGVQMYTCLNTGLLGIDIRNHIIRYSPT